MAAPAMPRRLAAPPLSRWGGGRHGQTLFRLGILAIAVHVLDDNFVHRGAGLGVDKHALAAAISVGCGLAGLLALGPIAPHSPPPRAE